MKITEYPCPKCHSIKTFDLQTLQPPHYICLVCGYKWGKSKKKKK